MTQEIKPYDTVGAIIEYESGMMDDEHILVFFQHLVDTGMAWTLQGAYGRAAQALLNKGLINPKVESNVIPFPNPDEYSEGEETCTA